MAFHWTENLKIWKETHNNTRVFQTMHQSYEATKLIWITSKIIHKITKTFCAEIVKEKYRTWQKKNVLIIKEWWRNKMLFHSIPWCWSLDLFNCSYLPFRFYKEIMSEIVIARTLHIFFFILQHIEKLVSFEMLWNKVTP